LHSASFSGDEKLYYVLLDGEMFGKACYIMLAVEQ